METECINGEIVITLSSGNVIKYNREHYKEFIDIERRMLNSVQANIDEAERMLGLIDDSSTPKTEE